MRCESCGGEIEEGRSFCPHCGRPVVATGEADAGARTAAADSMALQQVASERREAPAGATDATRTRPVPMSSFDRDRGDADKSRRNIYIVVALASALLVAGLVALAMRPAGHEAEPRLEGALRPGSPEFEQFRGRVDVDFNADEDAIVSQRAIGDTLITMKPTVRNFTGRTINGLELRATSLDSAGEIIKARTVIPVPGRQPELEPNRTITFPVLLEGFKPGVVPAQLKLELTAVRFK
ncbi:MAG TPA: hypothetical protein VM934_15095 [Pyrinomonadaceae bacterium]|jgi:hypothetical protein|nr:hypothetical protein [Pyrinomonadaceae bacterium]